MAVSVVVLGNFLNQVFELEFSEHFEVFAGNSFLLGILFISFLPALLEETLFRGLLFNNLLRFTRPKNVILITGILFSFVHFSFISLIWLFPLGLILGYFRYRYRTIWYAVMFHMMYNASVLLFESYLY
jgi:membrane protease YdiL (CAAX protease family)